MKKSRLIALVLALVMVFAACSKGGNTKETGKETGTETGSGEKQEANIVFWHAMNGAQEEALKKLTDDFMKENPEIKVELQNQTGYKELQQKITATQVSPKDLPTMTQAYPDWMYNPIKDGLVYDLTEFTKNLEGYDDILEGFRQGTVIDEKVYSMPFNKSTEVLFYNEDALKELGREVPKTPEEVVEVSKAYQEATGKPGIGFDSLSNYYTTYITNKGQKFDPNFDIKGDLSKEAVKWHLDGVNEGYMKIAGTDDYFSSLLGNEQVLMYVGSNAGQAYVQEAVDGKFTVKAAPSPFEQTIQQGTDLFVFDSATDAQKQAAQKYLTFLTSKESQIYWGVQTGYVPVRKSALEDPEYMNAGTLIAPILKEATEKMFTNPLLGGANQAYREIGVMMETVLAQGQAADVDSVLNNYAATIEGYWSK